MGAGTVVPIVASDEEGGRVQRLRSLLGPLPSAEELGRTRSSAQVRSLAVTYGTKMARLGVDVDLAPVTDLGVRGYYIEQADRGFAADPAPAGAWQAGMRSVQVAPVAKHWPGHGQAANTHDRAATTPPLSTLERGDLLPFADLLRAGVPALMVGHLNVPGLTEQGLPATLSPNAYRYLRERAGSSRLLMTDSLSMGAIAIGMRLTPAQAAVRAPVDRRGRRAGGSWSRSGAGGRGGLGGAVARQLLPIRGCGVGTSDAGGEARPTRRCR